MEKGKPVKMEITIEQALPTLSHMALVQLQNEGVLKYLVSQNVDGTSTKRLTAQVCTEEAA